MLESSAAKLAFNAWRQASERLVQLEAALESARRRGPGQAAALAVQVETLRTSTQELYAAASTAARHSRGRRIRLR